MNRKERRRNAAEKKKMSKMGRLALRHEGSMWNAYYALPDTMKDAIPIGSISMRAVEGHPIRRQQFLEMMSEFVADIIGEEFGVRPAMNTPEPAPESERSGHA